ncbi:unnamed protein product [Brassica rapa subsp. trilocularis]
MEGVSSLTEWQPGRYERVIGFKCVIGNLMKLCTQVFVRAVHEAKWMNEMEVRCLSFSFQLLSL